MPSSGVQTCARSEEHTSELQSHDNLVCRLLLEKKKHKSARNADARVRRAGQARSPAPPAVTRAWLSTTVAPRASSSPSLWLAWSFFFLKKRPPPEFTSFPPPTLLAS